MGSLVKYFHCDFWDLFEVFVVNSDTGHEQKLFPQRNGSE
jgi:hypothetical protein